MAAKKINSPFIKARLGGAERLEPYQPSSEPIQLHLYPFGDRKNNQGVTLAQALQVVPSRSRMMDIVRFPAVAVGKRQLHILQLEGAANNLARSVRANREGRKHDAQELSMKAVNRGVENMKETLTDVGVGLFHSPIQLIFSENTVRAFAKTIK